MSAPVSSRLDAGQCIQGSFDEATGSLRTTANATVVNADIDVSLDASEDNVAIADSEGHQLDINPDGSINVSISSPTVVSLYSEVSGVVTGITTLVASYSALINNKLQKIEFSGTNIAEYELVIGGIAQDKKRTYFGNGLNGSFYFDTGLNISTGTVIELYVVHTRSSVGEFNARIQILQG